MAAIVVLSMPVPRPRGGVADGANPSDGVIEAAGSIAVPAENTLSIPKLNLHVPVVYGAGSDGNSFEKALEHGVAHYEGTARPGEAGNVVIFGHSSNDWWEPGDFKFVFVLLDHMKAGDVVGLDYQGKRHYYVVTGTKIVEPTQVGVMYPTADPTLTLITCTPPGTSLKRFVVTAREARSSTNMVASAPSVSGADATTAGHTFQSPESIIGTSGVATQVRSIVMGIIEKFVPAE